ncbi:hypothetical protein AC578_1414 [Pseudocercospora eumusae]|uniref:Methyltransferase domain-containing protein n=1 Tax=Pseudocercospora eumusae TaxID=321146 RepID=A0A139HUN9_9PEZI|nr:hypothetical protein AC578_1414 [Pseudocercospora eumusae]KXT06181.1 hypothetical protein AC578_1414 [Pseudocercospora eumusae]
MNDLTKQPRQLPGCCASLSSQLIDQIITRLPRAPSLVFSIGCGTGLLEAHLLRQSCSALRIYGVEVPSCHVKYLPAHRVLRVPSTAALHTDAAFAEVILFVYPRNTHLIAEYCSAYSVNGALEQAMVIVHSSERHHAEHALSTAFTNVELVTDSGLPEYEVFLVASCPKVQSGRP